MRWWLVMVALAVGCAARQAPATAPTAIEPATAEPPLRACESCRQELQACRHASALASGTGDDCLARVAACRRQRGSDEVPCAGLD